ncbi:chalcone isomerase family protein [Psychroflexus sp. ALD_RP9]|uniref:chalcone isomerase family protein n=1 Tax=Psychroflexus sp. ALD_RP9 TaxID=2777186 RepID=UPI001A8F9B01|nr:chalcone isomerase family protein [Psychroflexus sp. ALD_RP9]QSS96967.1 chalcone isomerase family protein [Psychroflexus sp. ALD_RP9]
MKKILIIALVFSFTTINFAQTEVSGINFPSTTTFGQYEVKLNGAGVREKFWMDMYVGGLYLTNKSHDADAIINADEAMEIKLHIVSGLISSNKMTDAVEDGFENSTDGNTRPIRQKIDQFKSFFNDEINKKDVFDITYQPGIGIVVYKNGKESGRIKGLEFKKALFGIWLCDKPADKDLKESMLYL